MSAGLKVEEAAALLPIQPSPLDQPSLKRESLPELALWLTIACLPWDEGHRADCLEVAVGLRCRVDVCQGKLILQLLHK